MPPFDKKSKQKSTPPQWYLDMTKEKSTPEEWEKIIKVDNSIRDSSKRGLKDKLFLHRTLVPIDEAYLQEDQEELFMCEEGYCGI